MNAMRRENARVQSAVDTSDEAIQALIAIEEKGGTADLQFTGFAPMLRALMEERRQMLDLAAETEARRPAHPSEIDTSFGILSDLSF